MLTNPFYNHNVKRQNSNTSKPIANKFQMECWPLMD